MPSASSRVCLSLSSVTTYCWVLAAVSCLALCCTSRGRGAREVYAIRVMPYSCTPILIVSIHACGFAADFPPARAFALVVLCRSLFALVMCRQSSMRLPSYNLPSLPRSFLPPPAWSFVFVRFSSAWVALPMAWPLGLTVGGFGAPHRLGSGGASVPRGGQGIHRPPWSLGPVALLGGDGSDPGRDRLRLVSFRVTTPTATRLPSSRPHVVLGGGVLTRLLTRP